MFICWRGFFHLSNRAESLLTVLVLAAAVATLFVLYVRFPDLVGSPGAQFGNPDPGGILYKPNAVGVFILIIASILGILVVPFFQESIWQKTPVIWCIIP